MPGPATPWQPWLPSLVVRATVLACSGLAPEEAEFLAEALFKLPSSPTPNSLASTVFSNRVSWTSIAPFTTRLSLSSSPYVTSGREAPSIPAQMSASSGVNVRPFPRTRQPLPNQVTSAYAHWVACGSRWNNCSRDTILTVLPPGTPVLRPCLWRLLRLHPPAIDQRLPEHSR